MQSQSRKQWAALLLLLCLRDTAAFAANPVGNVGSGAEHAARSGVLEQLQQMMDDSHMPILISDDEDRYLCLLRPTLRTSTSRSAAAAAAASALLSSAPCPCP